MRPASSPILGKMKIAIIGYSSFVQRKLIDELLVVFPLATIDIFSRREIATSRNRVDITSYSSLGDSVRRTRYHFVYVSSENSCHFEIARNCLKANQNVVVDKPLAINKYEVFELCTLARKSRLMLSESLIWQFHSQVRRLSRFAEEESNFEGNCFFTIPMLSKDNFRMSGEAGSGVFWDMGVYAESLIKSLKMSQSSHVVRSRDAGGPSKQSLIIRSTCGEKKLTTVLGFGFRYRNYLSLRNSNRSIRFERLFTSEKDVAVSVKEAHEEHSVTHQHQDNSMRNYLRHVEVLLNSEELQEAEIRSIESRHAILADIESMLKGADA